MDTNAEIISGVSIAGIKIGDDAINLLLKIFDDGIEVNEIDLDGYFLYEINGGVVTISVDKQSNRVARLWCKKPYTGKYKGIISPGMRLEEILECTSKQSLVYGFLIMDNDFNAGFSLPDEYEDLDYVKDLPIDLILDEFHVMPKGWCELSR